MICWNDITVRSQSGFRGFEFWLRIDQFIQPRDMLSGVTRQMRAGDDVGFS